MPFSLHDKALDAGSVCGQPSQVSLSVHSVASSALPGEAPGGHIGGGS